ncbi:MAG TPA: lyase family protein, partial [Candidatus Thermoplasmatota archaeon]|nr:lyase family protein [Candidatus Thermoplasmatota archaeon]
MAQAQRVWESRTGGIHPDLLAYSETTSEDAPYVLPDVAGSIAHVLGLAKAGLLAREEAQRLVEGLQGAARDAEAGRFALQRDLEDVHMNLEARLTAELGDVGKKLHSGRSRNDQVAT